MPRGPLCCLLWALLCVQGHASQLLEMIENEAVRLNCSETRAGDAAEPSLASDALQLQAVGESERSHREAFELQADPTLFQTVQIAGPGFTNVSGVVPFVLSYDVVLAAGSRGFSVFLMTEAEFAKMSVGENFKSINSIDGQTITTCGASTAAGGCVASCKANVPVNAGSVLAPGQRLHFAIINYQLSPISVRFNVTWNTTNWQILPARGPPVLLPVRLTPPFTLFSEIRVNTPFRKLNVYLMPVSEFPKYAKGQSFTFLAAGSRINVTGRFVLTGYSQTTGAEQGKWGFAVYSVLNDQYTVIRTEFTLPGQQQRSPAARVTSPSSAAWSLLLAALSVLTVRAAAGLDSVR